MGSEEIINTISEAGRMLSTVQLVYVDLKNNVSEREVEPYSFRESDKGNFLFYGFCYLRQEIRAFNVENIMGIEVTGNSFDPKWEVEVI